jgi:aspartyl-tRNA(Asn)/glutamyl-tRNA(Gln) amidotransferase subunit A
MTAIHDLSAAELSGAYSRGELSPVEVTRAVLAHVDLWEPKINAMYRVHRESALAEAAASEARWRAGSPLSACDGVPVTIKENIYTKGDPAPLGTRATDHTPKTADAPPAARMREAGCVLLGKTTMPDFGMLSSGRSSVHGTTRNPWRLDRNPAGSSSGAGAAGAAGYGPFHIGTDIGGSIRLPAAVCGLFGLKPSLGRVPIDPPYLGRAAGPLTRSVADAALMMNVLTRPDERDFMSLPWQPLDYAANLDGLSPKGLRIGVLTDMRAGLAPEPAVVAAVESAGRLLEAAGAQVDPVESFLTPAMLDGVCAFFEARSYGDVARMSDELRAGILPFIVEWCTHRAGAFSGADVMAAYGQIVAMREAAARACRGYDFLLLPTTPVVSWGAEQHSPSDDPRDALSHIAFTVAFNMSEQPAASVPWMRSADDLPIAVQVVGQRFDDLGVLRLSRALEQMRGPQPAWPLP